MSKLHALSSLLYALSRIPGLGFLRSIARTGTSAAYMQSSMDSVKREFGNKEQPQTQPPPAQPGQSQPQQPQQ